MANQLYYIAIIPNKAVCEQVIQLMYEIRDEYGSSHALKSPPHMTVQMPFWWDEGQEMDIYKAVQDGVRGTAEFDMKLEGFDHFDDRVIFVDVAESSGIAELHQSIRRSLIDELGFKPERTRDRIHPHMTIANRDLSPEMFGKAWPAFRSRPFMAEFTVSSVAILKHNGTDWDVWRTVGFDPTP